MSLFQCDKCGCKENTALTDGYWGPKFYPEKIQRYELPKQDGHYCSACWDGMWHGRFERTFFPLGTMQTDRNGNLEPKGEKREKK